MSRRYWLILLSFIFMHIVGTSATAFLLMAFGFSGTQEELIGYTILISFSIGFVVILLLTLKTEPDKEFTRNRTDAGDTFLWIIAGMFMAYTAQIIAAMIEMHLFGIEPGSENTQRIVGWANAVPLLVIVVGVFVPIMEEIVFRMVIFGSLYKRFGFWIAALSSGLIFAVVHFDFSHLLVYLTMGVVFAYLYVKTRRIIVPIMAHAGINSFVMLVQVMYGEDLQRIIDQLENVQTIVFLLFGGLYK
ncbi:CPBP family intramembrane glutamic endopeptidase [Evansella tamaricis]|uniref:CPBP family intramembrane metalloprotease n=1 Tax=Evansella tamaricis TaxID=2069301 RepID=A0ABS6JIN4_9BACI|nr:type II CAAX endopeptidase family protein [Evansella tamaricis]MBU9713534.1 CPBP family intramembrane metalloprotease [Evansella tamaricis]